MHERRAAKGLVRIAPSGRTVIGRERLVPKPLPAAMLLAARAFGLRPEAMAQPDRRPALCRARWAAMWCARAAGARVGQIGRRVGGRDHATVLHGLRRAERLRVEDPMFRLVTDDMLQRLTGDAVPPVTNSSSANSLGAARGEGAP